MAILIVEDESDLSDVLSYLLRRAGHEVIVAFDGETALQMWREKEPELVLLDIGIPRKDGWDVCRTIRAESNTPVIIVSGGDTEDDMVKGFDLGAVDYVVKPFSPRLLHARIRSALNHSGGKHEKKQRDSAMTVGDLGLNGHLRTMSCKDRTARLTRLEFQVLQELALSCGQVISHAELIERVWGYRGEVSSNIVKGHIRGLRLKLKEVDSATQIRIVPSVGYIMEMPAVH